MFRTADDFAQSVLNEQKLLEWATVRPDDVIGIAQAFDLWASGELIQRAATAIGTPVVPIGLMRDSDALGILTDTRTTVLDTTPSRLRRMLLLSSRLQPAARAPIRVVMVSGEPLPADLRELTREIWGADLYDQYGSEETDGLGGNESPGGTISLLSDDFVFELLDPADGDAPGEVTRRLVVTSLYHRGTPLVRYVLDDIVRLNLARPSHVSILGRSGECFFLYDSVKLYPYQVEAALARAGLPFSNWQCVLDRGEGTDHLTFRYLALSSASSRELTPAIVCDVLSQCTYEVADLVSKDDLKVSASPMKELPEHDIRGKTMRFIDIRPAMSRGA